MGVELVTDPAEVGDAWLTRALVDVGLAPADARVVDHDVVGIGAGKVGDSARFTLRWDPPGAGPATVVGKFPAADPASRNAGVALGNYDREVRFYRHLAPTLDVRAPACHAAELDEATGLFVLLLEDLAPAQTGDQLTGCTVAQAEAAVLELVGLHAPRTDDPTLAEHEAWLGPRLIGGGDELATVWAMVAPMFVERYADAVDADTVATVERLMGSIGRWVRHPGGPVTVTHNDYRLDNLLFGHDRDGATTVAVVDWQTVGTGPGIADVSYFIGAGLVPEDRRAHESDLVAAYLDAMGAAGVELDREQARAEYRRSSLAGLVMAVFASSVVGADDRSDAMFATMAERHAHQALDLDAFDLI